MSEALIAAWGMHWEINEGYLTCRHCGAHQLIESARRPFKHSAGCTKGLFAVEMPWVTLAASLRRLHQSKQQVG